MRISDITTEYLKLYLRVDYDDDDRIINDILLAAKAYISGYTGLSYQEMEYKHDLAIALLSICGEMYDDRQITIESDDNINPVVTSILNLYCVNLL